MIQNRSACDGPQMKERLQKSGPKAALLLPVIVIAIVSFAVYSNAVTNGFIYDDHSQVLKNYLIRDIKNVPEIFHSNVWTFEGAPPTSNYYRPMLNLFYMLTYYVFGLDAWGFHLVNILFHAGNSVLVFFIASKLLGEGEKSRDTPPLRDSRFTIHDSRFPPFLAGLLFATHPIHTEAVTWIAGLSDVSFAFFYLLSFYLYMRSRGSFRWQYVFSVISFLLAVLCKEPGLTLPGILLAYEYAFRHQPLPKEGAARSAPTGGIGGYYLKRYVPYLLVACAYLAARFSVLGAFTPLRRVGNFSSFDYLINVFPLFTQYLYKLVLPTNLNFWPVYNPVTSLLSAEGIASFCVAAVCTGFVLLSLKKSKVVFLGLLLIIIPLAPALYIKGIAGKLFSERYLYLPSAGFVMLLAYLFSQARMAYAGLTKGLTIAVVLLIGMYSLGTVDRNSVWKDEYSLFADTVTKSPDSVVPRLEFGNALLAKGRFDEAIEQYRAAARMEPTLYVIYHHLGLAFAGKNRLYDAILQYQIALELNPGSSEVHADLGRAYIQEGFWNEAVRESGIAVALRPTAANHNLLGIACAKAGQIDRAVEEFRKAGSLDPTQVNYRLNLAEAIELEKSFSKKDRGKDFTGRYEEDSAQSRGIFRFAW